MISIHFLFFLLFFFKKKEKNKTNKALHNLIISAGWGNQSWERKLTSVLFIRIGFTVISLRRGPRLGRACLQTPNTIRNVPDHSENKHSEDGNIITPTAQKYMA